MALTIAALVVQKCMKNIFEKMVAQQERIDDLHQKEREVLFENEALAVKTLQAVSGASLIGALSQTSTLVRLAGYRSFLLFLTAMAFALVAAVLAAHWKHQYKMWHVKGIAEKENLKRNRRLRLSSFYLIGMRMALWVSLIFIATGFLELVVYLWIASFTWKQVALVV